MIPRSASSLNIARVLFVLVCELAGIAIALSTQDQEPHIPVWLGVLVGLLVSSFVIYAETLMRSFSLRGFSTGTFGLLVGLFCAWLLTKVNLDRLVIEGLQLEARMAESVSLWTNSLLFASLGFIGTVLALRTSKDDFALVIPYLHFRQEEGRKTPTIVDSEVLIDGRLVGLLESGFIGGRIVIPKYVLSHIQELTRSNDTNEKQSGERAMQILEELKNREEINVSIHESRSETRDGDTIENRLLETTRLLGGRVLTCNTNLTKLAKLEQVSALNLNDLGEALIPQLNVGRKLRLALVRAGKEDHQAVGYLSDGTMIVVNHGAGFIGTTQEIAIISKLQTQSGQMIFGELVS